MWAILDIHPCVLTCDNILPWLVTCDNQYPPLICDMWQYPPLRPPQFPCSGSSSVARRQAAKPGPISVLGPAKNMPGHRTLAVTAPAPAETAGTLWLYLCDVVMGWIMSLRRVSSFTRLSLSWLSCFYPAVSNGNIYARMLGGNNKFSWLPWQQLSIFRCQAIWHWMYV